MRRLAAVPPCDHANRLHRSARCRVPPARQVQNRLHPRLWYAHLPRSRPSLTTPGDRLLVGLNTGCLRIYRLNELNDDPEPEPDSAEDGDDPPKPKQKPADLLREVEKFSRRPVQQLAMIKESSILVSLSDNYVSIYDLHTYELQERLEKTKGAATFAVTSNIVKDPSTGIPSIVSRLAVAVKRRIILWSWQDMELMEDTAEITLISTVKSLTWATGTKIVAGMDPGFVMVDIESQEVTDIVKPSSLTESASQQLNRFGAVNTSGMGYMAMGSWVPKPMATRLGDTELLLAKDVNSLFIDTEGKALEKRQIPWTIAPEAIGYSYPYMLALQPPTKGALEVRNPDTLNLLQTISIPNAAFLHVPQPNISLAHAGKGFLVASDRCIWRMGALHYEEQIDELVATGRYDEAVSLLNMLEDTLLKDKNGRIREVQILKAESLFRQRRYRQAMDLFSDAVAPPEKVIALYPRSIAGDLSTIEEPRDSDLEAETEDEGEKTDEEAAPAEKHTGNTLTRAMFGRLVAEQKKTVDSDTASVRSFKADSDTISIKGKKSTDNLADEDRPLRKCCILRNFQRCLLTQCRWERLDCSCHRAFRFPGADSCAASKVHPLRWYTQAASSTQRATERALPAPICSFHSSSGRAAGNKLAGTTS